MQNTVSEGNTKFFEISNIQQTYKTGGWSTKGIMLPSKWENLNRCSTNLSLQKTTTCIRLQTEQIFSVNK